MWREKELTLRVGLREGSGEGRFDGETVGLLDGETVGYNVGYANYNKGENVSC